ncbi:hypothetical protein BCR41DRAFT_356889, partial [Lobosporangium transversale]
HQFQHQSHQRSPSDNVMAAPSLPSPSSPSSFSSSAGNSQSITGSYTQHAINSSSSISGSAQSSPHTPQTPLFRSHHHISSLPSPPLSSVEPPSSVFFPRSPSQERCEALEAEISTLKLRLKRSEQSSKRMSLFHLNAPSQPPQSIMAQYESTLSQLEDTKRELDDLETIVQDQERKLDGFLSEREALSLEMKENFKENAELQKRLQETTDKVGRLQLENRQLIEQVQELRTKTPEAQNTVTDTNWITTKRMYHILVKDRHHPQASSDPSPKEAEEREAAAEEAEREAIRLRRQKSIHLKETLASLEAKVDRSESARAIRFSDSEELKHLEHLRLLNEQQEQQRQQQQQQQKSSWEGINIFQNAVAARASRGFMSPFKQHHRSSSSTLLSSPSPAASPSPLSACSCCLGSIIEL